MASGQEKLIPCNAQSALKAGLQEIRRQAQEMLTLVSALEQGRQPEISIDGKFVIEGIDEHPNLTYDSVSREFCSSQGLLCRLSSMQARLMETVLQTPTRVVSYSAIKSACYPDEKTPEIDMDRLRMLFRLTRVKLEKVSPQLATCLVTVPTKGVHWISPVALRSRQSLKKSPVSFRQTPCTRVM